MTPQDSLTHRVTLVLEWSLGISPFPCQRKPSKPPSISPFVSALQVIGIYGFASCTIPLMLFPRLGLGVPCRPLIVLQIYAALWAGWCTATSGWTSAVLLKTVKREIIPYLSAEMATEVRNRLRARYGWARRLVVSWLLAVLFAVIAGYLASRDVANHCDPSAFELWWWCACWSFLFAAAAKVVYTSNFYRLFATCLEDDPSGLYALDPGRSAIIKAVSSMGRTLLVFWGGIALSLILVIPFGVGVFGQEYVGFDPSHNRFALVDVFVIGTLSVGWGSVVFLLTEGALRRAAQRTVLAKLRAIEAKAAPLTTRLTELNKVQMGELKKLNQLHNDIGEADAYRNPIASGLSLLIPFIPLLSLLFQMLFR